MRTKHIGPQTYPAERRFYLQILSMHLNLKHSWAVNNNIDDKKTPS